MPSATVAVCVSMLCVWTSVKTASAACIPLTVHVAAEEKTWPLAWIRFSTAFAIACINGVEVASVAAVAEAVPDASDVIWAWSESVVEPLDASNCSNAVIAFARLLDDASD